MPAPEWQPTGDAKADGIVKRYLNSDELDATVVGLNAAGVKAAAFVLAHSSTVQATMLAGNDIGDEGAAVLAEGIKQNRCDEWS